MKDLRTASEISTYVLLAILLLVVLPLGLDAYRLNIVSIWRSPSSPSASC